MCFYFPVSTMILNRCTDKYRAMVSLSPYLIVCLPKYLMDGISSKGNNKADIKRTFYNEISIRIGRTMSPDYMFTFRV